MDISKLKDFSFYWVRLTNSKRLVPAQFMEAGEDSFFSIGKDDYNLECIAEIREEIELPEIY